MNNPTPDSPTFTQRFASVWQTRVARLLRWIPTETLRCTCRSLFNAVAAPVRVGLSVQVDLWRWAWRPSESQATSVQQVGVAPVQWQQGVLRASPLPDLISARRLSFDDSLDAAELAAWESALAAVRRELPPGACHLVLSWPDEALWLSSFTVAGPVLPDELDDLVKQELAAVLPGPLQRAAWDVRLLGESRRAGHESVPGRRAWLARVGLGREMPEPLRAGGDLTLQCWALPLEWVQQIDALARRSGFASLVLEPHSVSWERASRRLDALGSNAPALGTSDGEVSSEDVVAFGAACREKTDGPDLWRQHRTWWSESGRRTTLGASFWALGLGLAVGAGHVLGGVQAEQWAREREAWMQRMQQLHSVRQEQASHRLALQQAFERRRQQAEQIAYNQQFARMLQVWAATVPEGLQWQRLSMRPPHIELQGQAGDADAFSRWIDRWPRSALAQGHHQLQWQLVSERMAQAPVGRTQALSVQLSWQPAAGGRE